MVLTVEQRWAPDHLLLTHRDLTVLCLFPSEQETLTYAYC